MTFKSSEMTGEKGTDITLVKDGVTLTFSNADLTFHYSYRIYKSSTLTVTSGNANITKVTLLCDEYKDKKGKTFLGDGFADMEGMTVSADKVNVTWAGDAKSVVFTASKHQVRAKEISVILKDTPSGIAEISNGSLNEEAPIYNLAGQRVNKEYKGVVIQNGKKFIKK
ncbi:hypothetical protein [Prevotella denticola]|uniref:hypothetical protein n=1 Tax=Prevotella denticola TaxID=28129 RepID=UPI002938EE83|nr:hypothetical protein [Prevotella denticola]